MQIGCIDFLSDKIEELCAIQATVRHGYVVRSVVFLDQPDGITFDLHLTLESD